MSQEVNIKELNERIKKESEFVDLITLEIQKVIVGQKNLVERFLRNMVRSLVGTLLEVGKGKLDLAGFQEIVNAKDRQRAGQSAPPQGLFLVDIGYEGYLPSTTIKPPTSSRP